MKKTLGLTLAILISIFALVGLGGNNQQPAPSAATSATTSAVSTTPSFGLVNVTQIYQESKLGVQAVGMLEEFQAMAMLVLEGIQTDINAAQIAGDTVSEQQYTMEMQSVLYSAQSMLEEEQQRLGAVVNDFIVIQMEQFRKNKGLGAIFTGEAMQAYDSSLDLTSEFMQFLNAQNVDLGAPLTLERSLPAYQPAETPLTSDVMTPDATPETAPEIAAQEAAAPEAAAPAPEIPAEAPAVAAPETSEPAAPATPAAQ